jgi:hypothetical protein
MTNEVEEESEKHEIEIVKKSSVMEIKKEKKKLFKKSKKAKKGTPVNISNNKDKDASKEVNM